MVVSALERLIEEFHEDHKFLPRVLHINADNCARELVFELKLTWNYLKLKIELICYWLICVKISWIRVLWVELKFLNNFNFHIKTFPRENKGGHLFFKVLHLLQILIYLHYFQCPFLKGGNSLRTPCAFFCLAAIIPDIQ